jgi:hypothetical protein
MESAMTKTLTLAIAIVALAAAGFGPALATTFAAPSVLEQPLGHGSERGECGRGDHDGDHDGDRC